MIVERLAIVGLGLIGGSLARALRKAQAVGTIAGFDVDAGQVARALELGVIDHGATTAAEAARGADVVVLGVPVRQTAATLRALVGALSPATVVTDVGSTKGSVLRDVEAVFGRLAPRFVGGHPIAGTERSGIDAGFAELFHGRRTILTPHAQQDRGALEIVQRLWQAAGSEVIEMDAARHDEVLGATSHLPHVLAYALVDHLAALDARREIFAYAAGGFRDFTRIASSSPQMWHDIVRANREALVPVIDGYLHDLRRLRDAVAADDGSAIMSCFERARAARERYLELVERPTPMRPRSPA